MADPRGAGPSERRGGWAREAATWLIAGLGLLLVTAAIVAAAMVVLTILADRLGTSFERLVAFIAVSNWSILQALRILTRWSNTP